MNEEPIKIAAKQNELIAVRDVLLEWADEELRDWKISSQEDKEKFSKILDFVNKLNEVLDCDTLLNL